MLSLLGSLVFRGVGRDDDRVLDLVDPAVLGPDVVEVAPLEDAFNLALAPKMRYKTVLKACGGNDQNGLILP